MVVEEDVKKKRGGMGIMMVDEKEGGDEWGMEGMKVVV